jgi:peptidoglycan-N-acetylmuramic acid deacetylase
MKKSQFISLGILLIAVTIFIIVGAFGRGDKDPVVHVTPTPTPSATTQPLETPTPTNEDVTPTPSPTPTPERTPVVFPTVDKGYVSSQSTKTTTWYWGVLKDENGIEYPTFNQQLNKFVDGFDYVFTNKIDGKKVVTLTFNEGWDDKDNRTVEILNILKEEGVKATFFLTKEYMNVEANHDVIRRMHAEGHQLGTRGSVSRQLQTLSVDDAINELLSMEEKLQEILDDNTVRMVAYRHIESFSRRDLALVSELGYKVVLWSYNYNDWGVLNVAEEQKAFNRMIDYMFNGTVFSFSASSVNNVNLLPKLIKEARSQGFEFIQIDTDN